MATKSTQNKQDEWTNTISIASGFPLNAIDQVRSLWWRNPLNRNSLRMTHQGWNWVATKTNIPVYSVVLQELQIHNKQLLQMERIFLSPYFLKSTILHLTSSSDTVMLQLHGGDLVTYLNNHQID